ncbi:MAG: GntP family permease [Bacteroidales bacterium]|nr:GntP family permease [Bacteroidales bacterium]
MSSALAAICGLFLSIFLIFRKLPSVFCLIAGALFGGILAGWGLPSTVSAMLDGVKDMVPSIVRILAAGVLSGMLMVTGAAESIALTIVSRLGGKRVAAALALATMALTAMGVFVDVAIITIAPVALTLGRKAVSGGIGLSPAKMLVAMVGGGKCGNIISPNPNTLIAAENFGAPLQQVMMANLAPAFLGLLFTLFVVLPLMPDAKGVFPLQPASPSEGSSLPESDSRSASALSSDGKRLPSFWASVVGPLFAIILLALRPLAGIVVDPLIALPAGGILGVLATRSWRQLRECLVCGLENMSGIALLLVGTGILAGVIKASDIKDVMGLVLSGWNGGGVLLAVISGALMSAATASTTAGATIASASFADVILSDASSASKAFFVSPASGAAMVNAGATMFDHLPHGSFFHATGGGMEMTTGQRLKLIPYESLIGFALSFFSLLWSLLV